MKKLLSGILILSMLAFGVPPANGGSDVVYDQASDIQTNTSGFNKNLSATDTNVQKALDTIDNLDIAGATYPGAGIALSTGSAWGTSITNNSANWNTAYGWGDHAGAGYLKTEADTLNSVLIRGNTSAQAITAGGIRSGATDATGQFSMYSDQGATDWIVSLNPNASMTGHANFYLPPDEPAGTYLLNMTTGGVIGYDTNTYLTAEVDGSITNELPTAGTAIDISGSPATQVDWDSTEVEATTWGAGAQASNAWTFNVSGTDHTMTAGNGTMGFSHNLTIGGDLTVTGDDITMTTNTSGAVLVADGTNFNPVVMSGDASIGTTGTVAVADDSHAHTGTTISGIDISDDTNLSAGSGIVLTGDALSHSTASGYVHTPADGASTQLLQYSSAGTSKWITLSADASIADGGAVTVADDSHAHTGTSLSGIDISSDTNLSGDTEIVLTGDVLSIGSAITRDTEWDTWAEHPAMTSAYVLVGNASNQPAAVAMSGDVTISNAGATAIGDNKILESMLKAVNSATDEYMLTYESTTGDFEWQEAPSGSGWTDGGSYIKTTTDGDSVIIGGATAVGTSGTSVLAIENGTAPSTSPADMVQLYASDMSQSGTGGTITTSGGKTIHTFSTSGTFTAPTGGLTVDVLIIGGGGGGGSYPANYTGGGGAGGYVYRTSVSVSAGANSIVVGTGGAAGVGSAKGSDGVASSAFSYSAAGGGGGGTYGNNGNAGGSGGGGGASGGAGDTPDLTPDQGSAGGVGFSTTAGGGGGGASAVGEAGDTDGGGNGGAGTANSISGASVTYAGGGGGGCHTNEPTPGTGGAGGGGDGGRGEVNATAGTDGLGGGGGGGAGGTGATGAVGGDGGDGVVIISYTTVADKAELKVRDEAGNVTTLSPHNFKDMPKEIIEANKLASDDLAWSYHSEKDGKSITVDMFKMAQLVEKITGEKLIYASRAVITNKEKDLATRIKEEKEKEKAV